MILICTKINELATCMYIYLVCSDLLTQAPLRNPTFRSVYTRWLHSYGINLWCQCFLRLIKVRQYLQLQHVHIISPIRHHAISWVWINYLSKSTTCNVHLYAFYVWHWSPIIVFTITLTFTANVYHPNNYWNSSAVAVERICISITRCSYRQPLCPVVVLYDLWHKIYIIWQQLCCI